MLYVQGLTQNETERIDAEQSYVVVDTLKRPTDRRESKIQGNVLIRQLNADSRNGVAYRYVNVKDRPEKYIILNKSVRFKKD